MTRSSILLGGAILFVTNAAFSHARITTPTPRDNASGHKEGPCGRTPETAAGTAIPKGPVKKVYPAGTTSIQLEFEETIAHSGVFAVDLSTTGDDKNFVFLKAFADPPGALYSTVGKPVTIDLPPGTTCANCTLRLRQVMCSSAGIPDANCKQDSAPNDNYYSCADIQILGPGQDAGPTPDAGSSDSGATGDASSGADSGSSASPKDAAAGGIGDPDDGSGDFNSSDGCSTTNDQGASHLVLGGLLLAGATVFRRRRR